MIFTETILFYMKSDLQKHNHIKPYRLLVKYVFVFRKHKRKQYIKHILRIFQNAGFSVYMFIYCAASAPIRKFMQLKSNPFTFKIRFLYRQHCYNNITLCQKMQ